MNLLSWNCHGLGNPRTARALKRLISSQDPNIVFLMETRKKDFEMNRLRNMVSLNNIFFVACMGNGCQRAGGLAVLW